MPIPINFTKWVNSKTLALITANEVYHWSMDGTEVPVKVFDKLPQLASATVLNYLADASGQWLLLIGVVSENGAPKGVMQLYSVEKRASQFVEGLTAAFTTFGGATVLCFANKSPAGTKLAMIPVSGAGFQKKMVDIPLPPDAAQDFPFSMQASEKYGVLYLVTKMGYIYLFDVESGAQIYLNRISSEPIFHTAVFESSSGIIGVNRAGLLLHVSVDPNTIVPYCTNQLNNYELGIKLAARCNLPGAENLFEKQFNALMNQGAYDAAASLAAKSPSECLRTVATLQRFKQLPHIPPNPPPLLMYFQAVMKETKLNKLESVELGRIVLNQGKQQMIDAWIKEDKIECSEDLGDIIASVDANLALAVYLRAKANDKVIQAFISMRQYDKILVYCKHTSYTPDYFFLLQNIVALDPEGALTFAQALANNEGGTLLEYGRIADVFISRNMIKQATSFLLDVLKGNRPEDANLQTRLLEINLHTNPQVANYILGQDMLSHYNRPKIAQLCERAGLYQRALEHYVDMNDIKRCIVNTNAIQPDFLVEFFNNLSKEDGLGCLRELLKANQTQNMQVAVQIATKYNELYGTDTVMKLFEEFACWKGLFYFLGAICVMSQDPEVHFKYIEAAVKCGQLREVERHTRESDFYDARRAADFLMEMKLPDQRPLINVCDRFDMVGELTDFLFSVQQLRVLEVYCKQVNPLKTAVVVGHLLDKGVEDKWLLDVLLAVGSMCPAEDLVREVEERSRLKLILPWLEARQSEGSTEVAVYNALAKVYVDNNNHPERFLEENEYYDSMVVGKYCEKRDPILAYLAYKKNHCDDQVIEVTNKNGLFKQQAGYLVDRNSEDVWAKVLVDNEHRRQVIDQVVGVALPSCRDAVKVGTAVKAFMNAELPQELMELLEKLVLHGTDFADNDNLQNLLLLTAIKADPSRVMDYINRLDNYHGHEIANICVSRGLYEEALAAFKKFNFHEEAAGVLITHIKDLHRANEFAEKVQLREVWTLLARAHLANESIKESIAAYLKANDPSDYAHVTQVGERLESWKELIDFLLMARKTVKEAFIDNSLIYAYARIEDLGKMEDLINQPNTAKLKHAGDRLLDDGLYQAAKIIYEFTSSFGPLATALVKLGQLSAAVDAARKGKSAAVWKEVMVACLNKKEYRLSQMCAVNLIVVPDDLEMVVATYERRGHFDELIQVLESGTNLDRAHMGIFTELGVQYAKHRPAKLMDHLQINKQRVNIRKLQRTCELCRLWSQLAYLYTVGDEFDNAVTCMMEHPDAWDHSKFKDTLVRVSNTDYLYRAAGFYLSYHPLLLVDLLVSLKTRLDHARVVAEMRSRKALPLIKAYLEDVQEANKKQVNNALNALYVEEGLVEKLRHSIDFFDDFDQIDLAQTLEKHTVLEFRRVAAYIYKKNGRWEQSVALSKQDKLYKDAMETTAASNNSDLAESLLRFFVEIESKECFAACLYHCYPLIRADVVMELAWRFNLMNLAMPFMIQTVRNLTDRVGALEQTNNELKEKVSSAPSVDAARALTVAATQGTVMDQSVNDGSVFFRPEMAMNYQTIINQSNDYNQFSYYGQ
eukprot:c18072_g1_i1.p1 GENE.c18072_g1_i1~~c18072_g1_i1.p1  ORF type:complete len:1681 (+),score=581.77 c18072_g1_i1:338-5044(+)